MSKEKKRGAGEAAGDEGSKRAKADEQDQEGKDQAQEEKDQSSGEPAHQQDGAKKELTQDTATQEDGASESKSEEKGEEEAAVQEDDSCGTLLVCGGTNWDLMGRRELPKSIKGGVGRNLWTPHRLSALAGVRVRLVASGSVCSHSVIVTQDGRVLTWGRNEKGQLGVGDTTRKDVPTAIPELKDVSVVGAACGRNHSLFLTDKGTVYSTGDNKCGQCGVGNQTPVLTTPQEVNLKGRVVLKVSCGAEFSMCLDSRGHVYSFGLPEYGQLGHNTDGRYFAQRNKLAFDCETSPKRVLVFVERTREGHVLPVENVEIVDIACGANHTVALDSQHRAFSWGFGGYGRLGHAEQRDEMVPRLIKYFEGPGRKVKSVHAGSTFSMSVSELGAVFLWGQTKRSGESNMYPKPIQDLSGWNVRRVACALTSILVVADDSLISWGPCPTYGEQGHGETKRSSPHAAEVKAVEGLVMKQVACGMGHSLLLARDHSPQEKALLARMPEYSPTQ